MSEAPATALLATALLATASLATRDAGHPVLNRPLRRPFASDPPPEARTARAIFIDRDGVVNHKVLSGYVRHPDEFSVLPEALAGIVRLTRETGYKIVLLTNQSVVGRGEIPRRTLEAIHEKLLGEVEAAGGRFDLLQVCAHAPWLGCSCRKPQPGMLLDAAQQLGLDLTRSWTIGDAVRDMLAGRHAGTRLGFIRYRAWHDERDWERLVTEKHVVDFVADTLDEAVTKLLELDRTLT